VGTRHREEASTIHALLFGDVGIQRRMCSVGSHDRGVALLRANGRAWFQNCAGNPGLLLIVLGVELWTLNVFPIYIMNEVLDNLGLLEVRPIVVLVKLEGLTRCLEVVGGSCSKGSDVWLIFIMVVHKVIVARMVTRTVINRYSIPELSLVSVLPHSEE
jgi:hypothetical protein